MKTPHPERVHVSKQPPEGFWYGNMAVLSNWEQNAFTFSYWRPFFRPHSISLGASGIVSLDKLGDSSGIGASVEVIKGTDPTSFRNEDNYFTRFYTYEELKEREVPTYQSLGDETSYQLGYMLPGIRTAKAIARMAVAESLVEYSAKDGAILSLMKDVLNRRQPTT